MQGHASPPIPSDRHEAARWRFTGLCRRMLTEPWEADLLRRVQMHFGPTRTDAIGPLNCSANPLKVISRELATLYLQAPLVRHDAGDVTEFDAAVTRSGLWATMPRYQMWAIGCREYLMRLHATAGGELRFRPVAPDMVIAEADPELPDLPVKICELRERLFGGDYAWTWDVLDVRDPEAPVYRVVVDDQGPHGKDVTEQFLGGSQSGDEYPYRMADGTPVLPYILHHAERLGDRLWNPYDHIELVDGSLSLSVANTFWDHVFFDSSWPQRYALNARPAGLETVDQSGHVTRQEIVTDPSTLLVMEAIIRDAQVLIGQYDPGGNPRELLEAIQAKAASLAQDAGISGTDLLRTSGDPRSGYALALSNEGKRAAQRRFAPQFRDADQRMMALSAILLNRAAGTSYPEADYSVLYQQIPLSPDELSARREHVLALMEAGLMSPIDAMMELNQGITRAQAKAELERVKQETPPEMRAQADQARAGAQPTKEQAQGVTSG